MTRKQDKSKSRAHDVTKRARLKCFGWILLIKGKPLEDFEQSNDVLEPCFVKINLTMMHRWNGESSFMRTSIRMCLGHARQKEMKASVRVAACLQDFVEILSVYQQWQSRTAEHMGFVTTTWLPTASVLADELSLAVEAPARELTQSPVTTMVYKCSSRFAPWMALFWYED